MAKEAKGYKGLRSETDLLYEEILSQNRLSYLDLLSLLLVNQRKTQKILDKVGDSTMRAEMTMPKSPIMSRGSTV